MTRDGDQGDPVLDEFTPCCSGHSLPQPLTSLTGSGHRTRQYIYSEADVDVAVKSLDLRVAKDVSTRVRPVPRCKNRPGRSLLVPRQPSAEHLTTLGAPLDRPGQLFFPTARHGHLAPRPVNWQFGETARVAWLWRHCISQHCQVAKDHLSGT